MPGDRSGSKPVAPGGGKLIEGREVECVSRFEFGFVLVPVRKLPALGNGSVDGETVAVVAQLPKEPLR